MSVTSNAKLIAATCCSAVLLAGSAASADRGVRYERGAPAAAVQSSDAGRFDASSRFDRGSSAGNYVRQRNDVDHDVRAGVVSGIDRGRRYDSGYRGYDNRYRGYDGYRDSRSRFGLSFGYSNYSGYSSGYRNYAGSSLGIGGTYRPFADGHSYYGGFSSGYGRNYLYPKYYGDYPVYRPNVYYPPVAYPRYYGGYCPPTAFEPYYGSRHGYYGHGPALRGYTRFSTSYYRY